MSENNERALVKYYTKARKFPQLLGRMPDGTKIPGGPYTVHQLLSGVAMLIVAAKTMGIWGAFGTIGNVVVLFALVYGTIFVIGRMPTNGRNPLLIVAGLLRVAMAPRTGRFRGRAIRFGRPRRLTHRVNVYVGATPGMLEKSAVSASTPSRLANLNDSHSTGTPLTALQKLLAETDQYGATRQTKAVR